MHMNADPKPVKGVNILNIAHLTDSTFDPNKAICCIYHSNCGDGLIAAAIIAQLANLLDVAYMSVKSTYNVDELTDIKTKDQDGEQVTLVESVDLMEYNVIVVDYSIVPSNPKDDEHATSMLRELRDMAQSLMVFDHHASVHDAVKALPYFTFDNATCGAELTYRNLLDGTTRGLEVVNLVQDYDLWQHTFQRSTPFWLGLLHRNESPMRVADHMFGFGVGNSTAFIDSMCAVGDVLIEDMDKTVSKYTAAHKHNRLPIMEFAGIGVPVINCSTNTPTRNAIGDALSPHYPFVVLYWDIYDDKARRVKRIFSLRGDPARVGLTPNLGAIAKHFGGGGHADAAAFSVYPSDSPLGVIDGLDKLIMD